MFTLDQARALLLESELGTDEILFYEGLPLTAPSPAVAPLPPVAPQRSTKKSLKEISVPDHRGIGQGQEILEKMRSVASISDLMALQREHPFYLQSKEGNSLLSGSGPQPCRIVVVAGRFQPDDFKASIPFSGQVGAMLNELFKSVQLSLNLCWQTALFKANWSKRFLPRERKLIRDFFAIELNILSPSSLVVLGEPALELLLDRKISLAQAEGLSYAGVPLYPISHPLQWLQQPQLKLEAQKVLEKIQ